jgi:ATP-dependent protease ClpP protease subunit
MELFKSDWSNFEKKDDKVIIHITGIIGGDSWWNEDDPNSADTKQKMKDELKAISDIKAEKILVIINSPGGSVDHGLAIHDMLATHSAEVETEVRGLTASAATFIAQVGATRKMSDNALYLVHNASNISWGNKNDIKETLQDLETIDNRIANIYAKRSGKGIKEFEDLMNENNGHGKWLTVDEAIEAGLVDESVEPTNYQNNISDQISKFNYPEFTDLLPKPEKTENTLIDRFQSLLNKMGDMIKPKETVVEPVENKTDEQLTDELLKEFENKVTDLEQKITDITAERDDLQAKYDASRAKKTIVKKDGDVEVTVNKEKDESILDQMPTHLKSEFKLRKKK